MGHLNTNLSAAESGPATVSDDSATVAALWPFDGLQQSGARLDGRDIPDFGAAGAEAETALTADVVAPLADRAVIRARGAEVDAFLQGQLSNDVRELSLGRAQLTSYSTPKGRVLAVFTMIRRADAVWLETQADIATAICKRLRMFVLRSKLVLDEAGSEVAGLGLSGPNAAAILAGAGLPVPEILWGCAEAGALVIVKRPGAGHPRYTVHGPAAALAPLWADLAAKVRPVGSAAWRLLDILAGLPAIHADTGEQHVAQMLNLDQLEGISFAKGCYPGQEIVARLHYLGSLKRRMFAAYCAGPQVARGSSIYAADGATTQPVGDVLDSVPHPTRGQLVQLVLQISHREGSLRLGALDGPELQLIPA
ncbi:MAG: folate-binding protein YgfZ [Nevskia sp.]